MSLQALQPKTLTQGEFFKQVNRTSWSHGYAVYRVGNDVVLRKSNERNTPGIQYVFKNAFRNRPDTPLPEKVIDDIKLHFPDCIQA